MDEKQKKVLRQAVGLVKASCDRALDLIEGKCGHEDCEGHDRLQEACAKASLKELFIEQRAFLNTLERHFEIGVAASELLDHIASKKQTAKARARS